MEKQNGFEEEDISDMEFEMNQIEDVESDWPHVTRKLIHNPNFLQTEYLVSLFQHYFIR